MSYPEFLTFSLHLTIVAAIMLRVIMKRPSTGVALAWLLLVAVVPFVGAAIYFLIGERRVPRWRRRRITALGKESRALFEVQPAAALAAVDWSRHDDVVRGLDRLGRATTGSPTVRGSTLALWTDTLETLAAIAREIDAARTSVTMEFYIWYAGGAADEVLAALMRAARRGVDCRILVDAVGARPWWRGEQPAQLREAGVHVLPALPVGLFRTFVGRADLRLHRKILVIDGEVAWTGSMNLVDPRYFKTEAGVGEWVDAMVRVEGGAVVPLAMILIGDWSVATGEPLGDLFHAAGLDRVVPKGAADMQVIPSGPGDGGESLPQMLLALINAAREELVVTTPYFAPDEAIVLALRNAALRGVAVSLVVPEKVDSWLTRHASRSFFDDLVEVGARVLQYRGGLLHTKSITVDRSLAMFGTVNLDMRSLWLNYEVGLFVYDADFATRLHSLQQDYVADSTALVAGEWARRPFRKRLVENTLRLVAPLV